MINVLKYLLVIVLVILSWSISFSAEGKALASYLEGSAFKSKDGKDWKPFMKGEFLGANESVKTGIRTRLELTLPDGSRVRFSEKTTFKVESLLFTEEERGFEIKVFFGKVWSKAKKFKKASNFEVKTATAVAGIRGTTFRIDANEDLSSLVKVYEGEVSVNSLPTESQDKKRKPKYISGPKEVPGPHEVSREEWSYIVKSWQQITVSPKGVASKPVSFSPEDDKSDWVLWNQEMDKR